jgi:rhodanese-related sulfurtransferase
MAGDEMLQRRPKGEAPMRVPRVDVGDGGFVCVDPAWGTIQPLHLPGGVETVGELEVIAAIRAGMLLVDTRQPEYVALGTIPSAVAIRHQEIVERLPALAPEGAVVLFCNGPQCAATPQAIAALLDAGWDPARLRYYRGGIHDWVTLGLPVVVD